MPKFQKKIVIENKAEKKFPDASIKTMEPAIIPKISPEEIKQALMRLQVVKDKQERRLPFWRRILQPVVYLFKCLMKAALTILATIGAAGLVALFIVAVAKFSVRIWNLE